MLRFKMELLVDTETKEFAFFLNDELKFRGKHSEMTQEKINEIDGEMETIMRTLDNVMLSFENE